MRSTAILMELEALAAKLGVEVIYEKLPQSCGGLCRLRDQYLLFVERSLEADERVQVFIDALRRFPLDGYQMLPRIRHLLEEHGAAMPSR
jgi:hypothetical protein